MMVFLRPMQWAMHVRKAAVVVEMNSHPVNKMNPGFFRDIHENLDRLEKDFPGIPVVLTGLGDVFSAGLDFEYSFSLFASQDPERLAEWFREFRATMLRMLTFPRLTVAAVNGHAFAGGLILALCCDFQIGAEGPYQYSLNEVPIGIPMPSLYTEIIRMRIGDPRAWGSILTGKVYSVSEAQSMGFIQKAVEKRDLVDRAVDHAIMLNEDCREAYLQSKKNLLAPTLERIENLCPALDKETLKAIAAPGSIRAQSRALERLKRKKGNSGKN